MLARAKTGTGKTLAFLIPSVEMLARLQPPPRPGAISVLIISPTRELATQIQKEAQSVLTHHSFKAQVVYGGTNINAERTRVQRERCDFLIATPGRLTDHIENSPGFRDRLAGLRVLTLDEADQLLDMGFRKDIEKILAVLPKQRQTLLFSATMPPEVRTVAGLALRRDHAFVDTVGEEATHTHEHVRQTAMVAPMEAQLGVLLHTLRRLVAEDADAKVIVFFCTARATQFHAELFNTLGAGARTRGQPRIAADSRKYCGLA